MPHPAILVTAKAHNKCTACNAWISGYAMIVRDDAPDVGSRIYHPECCPTESLEPVHELRCACCGEQTNGRQWFNRDTGYGLCAACVDYVTGPDTPENVAEREESYGYDGVHYRIKEPSRP